MKLAKLALSGALLPLALSYPALAAERNSAVTGPILLAQTDCEPGTEGCPTQEEVAPTEAAPTEAAPTEAAPAEEEQQVAPEAQPAEEQQQQAAPEEQPVEEQQQQAVPEEQPVEEQQQQAAPEEQPVEEQQQQAVPEEQPVEEQQQQAAPEAPPAEEQQQQAAPQEAAPAEAGEREDAIRRARRRQQELQQQEAAPQQPTQEQQQQQATEEQQPAQDTTVEQQLEAQGDREEARRVRSLRENLLDQLQQVIAPTTVEEPSGRRDRRERRRERFYDRDDRRGEVVERRGGDVIIRLDSGGIYVEPDVPDEGGRLLYGADNVEVEQLRGGRTRTTVYRRNGAQIVTVRDRYGDIVYRARVLPDGREFVLIDNRFDDRDDSRPPRDIRVRRPRVNIPRDEYIVDLGRASRQDIRRTLLAPPVDTIEQQYTLDEVLRNEDIRAYSPRIDLDTITFDFGSATIGVDQMPTLFALGEVMEEIIAENPDEVYLIEGHTDLVGTDYDNLLLSYRRAEAVAVALSQNFDIPPENLVTEGYGEQYPKVPTQEPERLNRRAAVLRLTDIIAQN